jgi:hypothetical protein
MSPMGEGCCPLHEPNGGGAVVLCMSPMGEGCVRSLCMSPMGEGCMRSLCMSPMGEGCCPLHEPNGGGLLSFDEEEEEEGSDYPFASYYKTPRRVRFR